MNYVRGYVSDLKDTLNTLSEDLIHQVIGILHSARLNYRTIFIMGNGGSATTATHFVADLSKNTRKSGLPNYRVVGLTDNMAMITAYANDEGYENVFAQQLASLVQPHDVVIAISASGNSPNVLRAVEVGRQMDATTIGLTGFDGGKLGTMVDVHIHVPSRIIEQVEDIHLMLEHLICKALREDALRLTEVFQPIKTSRPKYLGLPVQIGEKSPGTPSFTMLNQIHQELEGHVNPHELLQKALQVSLEMVGASSGSIMVFDSQGKVVEATLAYDGELHTPSVQQMADTVEYGLAGWVMENRQPALVPSTRDDPRWLHRSWDVHEPRSAVCVPLMDRDRVVGVMTLVQSHEGQFNQEHLVLLSAIAVIVSINAANTLRNSQSVEVEFS